ncbi:MAG: nitroreductase family deazaflavin-dependent oxidoreductase [Acidimicrobiaceae bacterium]|nr:nitroreductase family deazaflavin-dependent oxidoreductase [Acidimicrobiaceae bacterium]
MDDVNEWNRQIIEEFRANEGKVGGPFEGMPLSILHSTGRKSGQERLNPLAYQSVEGGWAIFGSKAGATSHPDWYYNVTADADVTIEVGTDTVEARARVAEGDERTRIWETQKANVPTFAEYEQRAGDREIPVVVLEPR